MYWTGTCTCTRTRHVSCDTGGRCGGDSLDERLNSEEQGQSRASQPLHGQGRTKATNRPLHVLTLISASLSRTSGPQSLTMMRVTAFLASLGLASAQLLIGGGMPVPVAACPEDTNSDGSVDGTFASPPFLRRICHPPSGRRSNSLVAAGP